MGRNYSYLRELTISIKEKVSLSTNRVGIKIYNVLREKIFPINQTLFVLIIGHFFRFYLYYAFFLPKTARKVKEFIENILQKMEEEVQEWKIYLLKKSRNWLCQWLKNPSIKHFSWDDRQHITEYNNTKMSVLLGTKEEKQTIFEHVKSDIKLGESLIRTLPSAIKLSNQHGILLTGASGFLGSHLLKDLLELTNQNIFYLLRGEDPQKSMILFEKTLDYYKLGHIKTNNRIYPIFGDLSKPQLGLDNSQWQNLAKNVDKIYHCAAYVHHLHDYSRLRTSNVLSVMELLKLATLHQMKSIHFISSIGTSIEYNHGEFIITEEFPSDDLNKNIATCMSGYMLSKWTAERILKDAIKQGFFASIYRTPQIFGHSVTGIMPTNKVHLLLLIKSCIQAGVAPINLFSTPILPVDFLSNIIVQISLEKTYQNKVYNLYSPEYPSSNQIFKWLIDEGYNIEMKSKHDWINNVLSKIGPDNCLFPLLPIYLDFKAQEASNQNFHIISKNFNNFLQEKNLKTPKIGKKLFMTYFKFLEYWFKGII